MPASSHLLNRAIQIYRSGDSRGAARVLAGLLLQEPDNASAWAWFGHIYPQKANQLAALEEVFAHQRNQAELRPIYEQLRTRLNPTSPAPEQVSSTPAPAASASRPLQLSASILVSLGLLLVALALVLWQTGKEVSYTRTIDRLLLERETLQSSYNGLSAQLAGSTSQLRQLSYDYQVQSNQQTDLQARFDRLKNDYDATLANYTALQRRFSGLNDQYLDLEKNSVRPPYIIISGREVDMAFKKLDHSILHWNIGFDSLEASIEHGQDSRSHLFNFLGKIDSRYALEMHASNGKNYHVVDYRMFVDSGPFQEVMKGVFDQSPDEEAFLRETWNIMTQLTTYAFDPDQETPRYPLETLLAGGGDCEDTSILFASMIQAAPVNWKVSFIYMDGEHPDSMVEPNHLAVAVDTGSQVYVVETTSKDQMTPYAGLPDGWYLALP